MDEFVHEFPISKGGMFMFFTLYSGVYHFIKRVCWMSERISTISLDVKTKDECQLFTRNFV